MEEIKEENVMKECRVRGESLRNALDKVNAHVSDILVFNVQWEDLNECLESVKGELKARFMELESKEVELKGQSFALEERAKVVEEAEAKLADLEAKSDAEDVRLSHLRTLVEECEAEKVLKASELSEMVRKTHVALGLKGEELANMETDLERCRGDVSAEMESLRVVQTHRRQLDEEVERKTKDLTLVQDKLEECEEMIETSSLELIKTQDEVECKRVNLGEMEAELERHRVKVRAEMESLRGAQTHMRQLVEEVERKTKDLYLVRTKLLECEKLVRTSSSELIKTQGELECKQEQLGHMEADLERHRVKVNTEMESLRGTQTHMVEEVERKTKDLTLVQTKLVECEKLLETSSSDLIKSQGELECKQEQLGQMEANFQMHHAKVIAEKKLWEMTQSHSRELEEEIERKRKDLTMVLDKISECGRQLESMGEQLDSQQKLLETQSSELVSKEKELQELSLDIDLREQTVISLNDDMEETCQQMESKAKELENVQTLIEERSAHCESLKLFIKKLSKKQDSAEKEVDWTEKKLDSTTRHLERCIAKHKSKKKELRSVQSILSEIKEQVEEGEKRMQYLNSSNEELLGQLRSKQEEVSTISGALKAKRKHHDQVQSSILDHIAELNFVKQKIQDSLKDFQSKEEEQARLRASLMEREQRLELKEKELSDKAQQLKSAELKSAKSSKKTEPKAKKQGNTVQRVDLPNEDTLRDFDGSTSFSPNEVFTELPVFKSPGRFVLNAVEDALTDARLRGELSLKGPILMPLVPLLEELARVGISTDPGLQNDATKVAHRWVKMMGASVAKSQREVWAFLQFIVAFGLVKRTKRDETLKLASCVAHFKHAPKLFQSLGLSDAIPSFVTQLLDKAIYIPAIRFMFYFKVENKFSPLEFLKEQIISLSCSAKEKGRYESQAEEANRDGATLREMMELIEDFKLEIDIPVALILKFMVPREIVSSSSSVQAQSIHMQASETDIQSSCIATDGLDPSLPTSFGSSPTQPAIDAEMYQAAPDQHVNVEVYQAGGSIALLQGQYSHHASSKRPRVDHGDPRPVIRPCFNPPSGSGRF